jgi:hypothetical protein
MDLASTLIADGESTMSHLANKSVASAKLILEVNLK